MDLPGTGFRSTTEKEKSNLATFESKTTELEISETETSLKSPEKTETLHEIYLANALNEKCQIGRAVEVNDLKELDNSRSDTDAGDIPATNLLLADIPEPELLTGGARPKVRAATKHSTSLPAFSDLSREAHVGDIRSTASAHEHRSLADFRRKRFDGSSATKQSLSEATEEGDLVGDRCKSLEEITTFSSFGTENSESEGLGSRELICDSLRFEESHTIHDQSTSLNIESSQILLDSKLILDEVTERVAKTLENSDCQAISTQPSEKSTDTHCREKSNDRQRGSVRTCRKKWHFSSEDDPSRESLGWPPCKRKRSGPEWLRRYETYAGKSETRSASDPQLMASPELNSKEESENVAKTDSYRVGDHTPLVEAETVDPVSEEAGLLDDQDIPHQDPSSKSGKSLWKKKKLPIKERAKRVEKRYSRQHAGSTPLLDDDNMRKASEIISELIDNVTELYRDIESYSKEINDAENWASPRPAADTCETVCNDEVLSESCCGNVQPPSKCTSALSGDHLCSVSVECEELRKLLDDFTNSCRTEDSCKYDQGSSHSSSSPASDDQDGSEEGDNNDVAVNWMEESMRTTMESIPPAVEDVDPRAAAKNAVSSTGAHEVVPGQQVNDSGDFETGFVVIEDMITSNDSIERLEVPKSNDSCARKKPGRRSECSRGADGSSMEAGDVPTERDTSSDGPPKDRLSKCPEISFGPCRESYEQVDEGFHDVNVDHIRDLGAGNQCCHFKDEDKITKEWIELQGPSCERNNDDEYSHHVELAHEEQIPENLTGWEGNDAEKRSSVVSSDKDSVTPKDDSLPTDEFDSMKAEPNSVSDISFDDTTETVNTTLNCDSPSPSNRGEDCKSFNRDESLGCCSVDSETSNYPEALHGDHLSCSKPYLIEEPTDSSIYGTDELDNEDPKNEPEEISHIPSDKTATFKE